ncbi:MAG: apolipoprotein N-acyltransferase [Eubacteriales bacterium]|nr:apolipoprotein N-acyltransferase [Eubacteriales bacterium]
MNQKASLAMSALSGLLMAVCFSCPALQFGAFAALTPLWLALRRVKSYARAWKCLFTWGTVYHAGVLHWLYAMAPLTRYGMAWLPSVLLLGAAIAAIALLQGMVLALPAACCARFPGNVWAFGCLFVLGEGALGLLGELAFPWARIGMACTASGWMQPASLFGTLGLSLALAWVNAWLGEALCRRSVRALAAAVGIAAAQFAAGGALLKLPQEQGEPRAVLLVQGNLNGADKWDVTQQEALAVYLKLSADAARLGADWVIWNETGILDDLSQNRELSAAAMSYARNAQVAVLCGALRRADAESPPQNVAQVVDGRGVQGYYAKRVLVPFGESLPLQGLWGGVFPRARANLTAGNAAGPIAMGADRVGVLICYESVFPRIARENAAGAGVLAVLTNDSWFGRSAALEQHCRHARFRAVEQGKWLLRAANTGITCVISPQGEVRAQLPVGSAGALFARVFLRRGSTVYAKTGDVVLLPGMGLLLWAVLGKRLRRARQFMVR